MLQSCDASNSNQSCDASLLTKSHYWRNSIQQKFRRESIHLPQTPLELWHPGTPGPLFSVSFFLAAFFHFSLRVQDKPQGLASAVPHTAKNSAHPAVSHRNSPARSISSSQRPSWWTWELPAQHDGCNSKGKTWWGTDKEHNSRNGIIPILYLHYLTVHNLFRMKPTILSADVLSWLQWHTLH